MQPQKSLSIITALMLTFGSVFVASADARRLNSSSHEKSYRHSKMYDDNSYIITGREAITGQDMENHWVNDKKSIIGMQLKLIYNMGKIYGYAVFINNANDFGIIDNTNLKLVLYNKKFGGGQKTFFLQIRSYKFQKLYLSRGDSVIAFPIDALAYGSMLTEGSIIEAKAECFHLTASAEIYIN